MRFIIDNPNDVIQSALVSGKFHEQEELELMKRFCPPKAHILDVGANVGNHSIYFNKFFDAEVIYAIEPIPRSYKLLLANIALNYCHKINVDYIGVGFGHTEATGFPLETYKDNLGSTRITPNPNDAKAYKRDNPNWEGETFDPVKIIRGDTIFATKQIDFIKMDIEGMEMFALEGLAETINKNKPNMFIEVSVENTEQFHEWVKNNGYKIMWEKLEPRIFCNYIIVHESKNEENTDMWSAWNR